MDYQVTVSDGSVEAWSRARLAFEPRGWQVDFRRDLRAALRQLPVGQGHGLSAKYLAAAPAAADLENVLLYNIGMASFGPLIAGGITCLRHRSTDSRHHVRYQVTRAVPDPGGRQILGMITADLGSALPRSAGQWWAALRPHTSAAFRRALGAAVTADVVLTGPALTGVRLANLIKPMLDGLIACFHAHDGGNADGLRAGLAGLGPAPAVWELLTDPSTAVLGVRPLVRPYRDGIAWNPADDLCSGFRIRIEQAGRWTLRAALRAG
jgi:hypothetical protein